MVLKSFEVWSKRCFRKKKVIPGEICLFLTIKALKKDIKRKRKFTDNYGHNTLRLFDVLLSFPFRASEKMRDYQ